MIDAMNGGKRMAMASAWRARRQAMGKLVRSRGFTLIELMIVVAIIAVLTAIAVPTYTTYITKTRRNAASACLSEYANYMERFYTTNLRYDQDVSTGTAVTTLPVLDCAAQSQTGQYYAYAFAAAPALSQSIYKIIATPQDVQASRDTTCGVLGIDQAGQRYYQSTKFDTAGLAVCWQH